MSRDALHSALNAGKVHAPIAQRVKKRESSRRTLACERKAVTGADLIWACSELDAGEIAQVYGRRSGVTVVPNGVDVEA